MPTNDRIGRMTKQEHDDLIQEVISRRRSMAGWQPIETAPLGDDKPYILVATGNPYKPCEVVSYGWEDQAGKVIWYNDDVSVEATHWMPLPAPPN